MNILLFSLLLVCFAFNIWAKEVPLRPPIEWLDRDQHFVTVNIGVENVIRQSIHLDITSSNVTLVFASLPNKMSTGDKDIKYLLELKLWEEIVSKETV